MKTVTAQWLSQQLRNSSEAVLVLDTRCVEDFNQGCIAGAVSVYCCGALILRRLKKGNVSVESLLRNQEDKDKYNRAKGSEQISVIVYDDGRSSCKDLLADSLASVLMKKLSREVKNVSFLEGGYVEFNEIYGELCTQPNTVSLPQTTRPSSLILQLNSMTIVSDSEMSSDSEGSNPPTPQNNARNPQPFQILPHLYLSCRKGASNKENLQKNNITRILNVTSEESEYQYLDGFTYHQIAVEDSQEVDMLLYLPVAFAFIEEARLSNEKVLVHCHAGMSRSVTVIIGYLMKYHGHTLNSAYDYVRQKKSNISPNFGFLQQLIQFEKSLRSSPADSGIDSETSSPTDGYTNNLDLFNSTSPTSLSPSPNFRRCILAA
jgi:protein-tyrosine phosphatase/rhodanese-related sulfurtransferase